MSGAALLAIVACARGDAAPADSTPRAVPVEVEEVTSAALAAPVRGTGTVSGKEETTLSFKIGGVVSRILVEPGQRVRAGQLLAELAPTEISSEVAKAQQGRAKAARDLERVRALHADSVTTLEQLQDATTALEVADQNLRIADFNRRYASIHSPGAGVVLQRLAEPNQLVSPGTGVLIVRSAARGLVLRVGLPDRDVVRTRVGDGATVTFDALPNERFGGRVSQIASAASPTAGTYVVEIALDGEAANLATGLVGRVEITTRSAGEYPLISLEALLEAEGDSGTVLVVSPAGDRAARRTIRVAQIDGVRIAVASGLRAGERVVVRGGAYIDENTPLQIANETSARRTP